MARIDIKGDIVINEYKPIYDWLGWDCVCPRDVSEAIDGAVDDPSLDVYINSGGGLVFAAQEIYSMLRADSRTHIHIEGLAGSAAGLIAMAGDSEISPVGMIMVHNVQGMAGGDYHEMDKTSRMLRECGSAIANAYTVKSGLPREEVLKLMDRETWLTAQKCLEYGFVDRISEPAGNVEDMAASEGGIRLTKDMMDKVMAEMKAAKEQEELKNELKNDILRRLDSFGS